MSDHTEWLTRGKYLDQAGARWKLGAYLGRIDATGIDVYEGSPRSLIDALFTEHQEQSRP